MRFDARDIREENIARRSNVSYIRTRCRPCLTGKALEDYAKLLNELEDLERAAEELRDKYLLNKAQQELKWLQVRAIEDGRAR